MSKLEDIIKQHSNLSSYIEDMNELTRTFETFVYDSYNIKNINSSPISEVAVYTKDENGKLQSEDKDWFFKDNKQLFINNMIPFLAYLPVITETKDGQIAKKVMVAMSENAANDNTFKNYISAIIREKLTEHKRIENSADNTGTDLEQSIKTTLNNILYQPGKAFQSEINHFLIEILPKEQSIVKLIQKCKVVKINEQGKPIDYAYSFKKKIYDNIQTNYKSWEIFLNDIYGSATDAAKQTNAEAIIKELYDTFRLPDNSEDAIGDQPDNIEDFEKSEDGSEQLKNGLSPEQLSQWTQISKVWEALKDIKIDGETTFFDALYNAFKSNETVLQQALTTYLRSISPKDGLIFRKGWTQQITTKFIQVIIVACIDDMVNRGAYHNDMRIPEEKLSTLQQKYQNALDHGNTQAIEKLKKEVLNNFGVDARKQLDEMRPKQKQVKSKG